LLEHAKKRKANWTCKKSDLKKNYAPAMGETAYGKGRRQRVFKTLFKKKKNQKGIKKKKKRKPAGPERPERTVCAQKESRRGILTAFLAGKVKGPGKGERI